MLWSVRGVAPAVFSVVVSMPSGCPARGRLVLNKCELIGNPTPGCRPGESSPLPDEVRLVGVAAPGRHINCRYAVAHHRARSLESHDAGHRLGPLTELLGEPLGEMSRRPAGIVGEVGDGHQPMRSLQVPPRAREPFIHGSSTGCSSQRPCHTTQLACRVRCLVELLSDPIRKGTEHLCALLCSIAQLAGRAPEEGARPRGSQIQLHAPHPPVVMDRHRGGVQARDADPESTMLGTERTATQLEGLIQCDDEREGGRRHTDVGPGRQASIRIRLHPGDMATHPTSLGTTGPTGQRRRRATTSRARPSRTMGTHAANTQP